MHVWIRNEPLNSSAINYSISHHINANTLRRTVNYAKNKGASGYPKLEYSIWRYIACNKINIPESVAWMYFETFFFMSNYGSERNMAFDSEISKCKTSDDLEKLKDSKKVDLYTFILHLYIQQFYSIDLKSSFMSREEWPVNRNEGHTTDRRKSRTIDETNFMNFVTKNIEEIICLYVTERTNAQNEIVSDEILQALNFLLEGSLDNYKSVTSLSNLLSVHLKQPVSQSQFPEGKLYVKNLVSFLKNYIEPNPFGLSNCLRNGKRISPSIFGGAVDPKKIGKIVTNANLGRRSDQIVFLTQVLKQTYIEMSETFRHSQLYIDKCLYSYIYILQPLKLGSIKKCRKSLLFIGPVEKSLTIDSCAECTIVTVCRRLILRNCSMCDIFLLTPSNPIILNGCDNIKLAPYNSTYPNITEDAYTVGLSDVLNMWDKPTIVAMPNQSLIGSHWSLMSPSQFSLISVPIDSNKSTNANELVNRANEVFGHLTPVYEQELKRKYKAMEENLGLVQAAGLNGEQRVLLQKFIENSFKESLQITGDQRQLDHLAMIMNNFNGVASTQNSMANPTNSNISSA